MRDYDRENVKAKGAARKAARTARSTHSPRNPRPMRELAY